MAMNGEAEIRALKRRVGEPEDSLGFLTRSIKSLHKDLLAFQARTEQRFDQLTGKMMKVDGRFDRIDGRLGRVESELRRLRQDMPGIVGDAVRAAMRARSRKMRKAPE